MTLAEYIKDRILVLVLQISCMLLLFGFLNATGYPPDFCVLIGGGWVLAAGAYFGMDFWGRKRYFLTMTKILEQMEERYLLGELMPDPKKLEDRLYRDMIRFSNKSVIERIHVIEKEKKEYQEFIESWVHEIKAPITGISLICENHKDEITRRIWIQNRKIENYVDMALYYARADEVYKDYMVQKTDLSTAVSSVLSGNKYFLIQNGVEAEVSCRHFVYTDKKWIMFILNQLLLNSVKYKKGNRQKIRICTQEKKEGVWLVVEDDGIGIKKEDLPRVFEKGFTGQNGRSTRRATGMGLYLCKELCRKLGIEICIFSEEGKGVKVILKFPVGKYYVRNEGEDVHEKIR